MKNLLRCVGLFALLAASLQAAVVVPLPPFTVYGKVRNWNGQAFSTSDSATVIVKVKGVEVNRCEVKSGAYPGLNYRVEIPMSSVATEGTGKGGDAITFQVYYGGQMHDVAAGSSALVVGNPAGSVSCDLIVGTDSDKDGLPDEYEALLAYYYDAKGWASGLADISPDDDFDEDGFTNLQEFQAGTSPVEKADFLRITSFGRQPDGSWALSFLSAPGRSYTLPAAGDVRTNAWDTALFATATNEAPTQGAFFSDTDANVTLYLLPSTNSPAFYRLRVE